MASNKRNFPSKFDIDMTPLHDFMKQMDNFFNHSFKHMNSHFNLKPFWVHVNETDRKYIVEADLPGYKREQIEVEIIGNQLRIGVVDHNRLEEKNNQELYVHNTQSLQQRERIISLPFEIPKRETKASYRDGLLKVTIPKRHSQREFLDINEN